MAHDIFKFSDTPIFFAYPCCRPPIKLPSHLKHQPYIDFLPDSSELLTPLHFSPAELALLNGTNLLGATLDRRKEWEAEWREVRDIFADTVFPWGEGLTWYVSRTTFAEIAQFRQNAIINSCPGIVI